MANKRDDTDLPDFDFEEFGDGGEGGFEGPGVPKNRSAMTQVAGGFVEGVTSHLFDERNQIRMIRSALPEGYGKAIDVADFTMASARDLYHTAAKEAAPVLRDAKNFLRMVAPQESMFLPKKLTNWIHEKDKSSTSDVDPEETAIAASLGEIFKAKAQDDAREKASTQAREGVRDMLTAKIGQGSISQLLSIRSAAESLVAYQDQVTAQFQRKSLELQFRSYFVQRKLLDQSQQHFAFQKLAYEALVKNTALPDIVKTHNSELAHQLLKERMFGAIGNTLRDWTRGIGKRIVDKAKGDIRDFFSSVGTSVQQMAMMGEMVGEMGGIAPGGVAGVAYNSAGSMAGSMAANALMDMGGGWLKNKLKDNKKIQKGNYWLLNMIEGFGGKAQNWANDSSKSMLPESVRSLPGAEALEGWLRDAVGTYRKSTDIMSSSVDSLDQEVKFNLMTKRSITDVIPGWLSRIHQELMIIRTGDPEVEPLRYSFESNSFEGKSVSMQRLKDKLYNPDQMQRVRDDAKLAQEGMMGKNVGGPKFKRIMQGVLLKIAQSETGFDPALLVDEDYIRSMIPDDLNLDDRERREFVELAVKIFRAQYGHDESTGKFSNEPEHGMKRLEAIRHIEQLRRNLPDPREILIKEAKAGNLDLIKELNLSETREGTNVREHLIKLARGGDKRAAEALVKLDRGDPTALRHFQHLNAGETHDVNYDEYWRNAKNPGYNSSQGNVSAGVSGGDMRVAGGMARGPGRYTAPTPAGMEPESQAASRQTVQLSDSFEKEYLEAMSDLEEALVDAIVDNSPIDEVKISNERLAEILKFFQDNIDRLGGGGGGAGQQHWADRMIHGGLSTAGRFRDYIGTQFAKGTEDLRSIGRTAVRWTENVAKFGKGLWDNHKDSIGDLYVKGKGKARLLARDLKEGKYRDAAGAVIKKWDEIKGAVYDENGNVVLTAEEFAEGLKERGGSFISKATGFLGDMFDKVSKPFDMAKNFAMNVGKAAWAWTKFPSDIYCKDDMTAPKLLARILRKGEYRLASPPHTVIGSVEDITGDIMGPDGNVVLTSEEIHKGLVDKDGKDIKGVGGRLFAAGKAIIGLGRKVATKAWEKAGEAADWIKGKASAGWDKLKGLWGDDSGDGKGFGFSFLSSGQKPVVTELQKIYKLLDDRLPGKKKDKNDADVNDDGIREGSASAQVAEREAREDEAEEDARAGLVGTERGFFAKFKGLFSREKKEDKEDDDSDSGSWIGNIFGMFGLGKLGKFVGGIAGKLGKSGLGALVGNVIGSVIGGAGKLLGGAASLVGRGIAAVAAPALGAAAGAVASGLGTAALWTATTAIPALVGGAAAVLTSPLLLPALALGATAYAGYKAYKYFTREKNYLAQFRMYQYGFEPDDEDRVPKLAALEDACLKIVQVTKGNPARFGPGKTVEELMSIFSVDTKNDDDVEKWLTWFQYRFKPVFLTHMTVLFDMTGRKELRDVDDDLSTDQKLDYIKRVHFPRDDNSPYMVGATPFMNDKGVKCTLDDVEDAYEDFVDDIEDDREEQDEKAKDREAARLGKKRVKEKGKGFWEDMTDKTKKKFDDIGKASYGLTHKADGNLNLGGFMLAKGVEAFKSGSDALYGGLKSTGQTIGKAVGGWSKDKTVTLDATIHKAATTYGVDESYLRTMAMIESGGNPKATSSTGAAGIYQFVKSTGKAYGLFPDGQDVRYDEAANVDAGARFAKDNFAALRKRLGRDPEPWMLYMAHQQGVGGFMQIYDAAQKGGDVPAKLRTAMDLNGGKGKSPAEFMQMWREKYSALAQKANAPGGANTSVAAAKPAEPATKAAAVATGTPAPAAKAPAPTTTAPVKAAGIAAVAPAAAKPAAVAAAPAASAAIAPAPAPAPQAAPVVAAAPPRPTQSSAPSSAPGLMPVSYSPDDMLSENKQQDRMAMAQLDAQRQAALDNTSSSMEGVVALLKEQLKVQFNMDTTLTKVSESLVKIEKNTAVFNGGSEDKQPDKPGIQKTPNAPTKSSTDAAPVSMRRA